MDHMLFGRRIVDGVASMRHEGLMMVSLFDVERQAAWVSSRSASGELAIKTDSSFEVDGYPAG